MSLVAGIGGRRYHASVRRGRTLETQRRRLTRKTGLAILALSGSRIADPGRVHERDVHHGIQASQANIEESEGQRTA
jgi:hypothetical protein